MTNHAVAEAGEADAIASRLVRSLDRIRDAERDARGDVERLRRLKDQESVLGKLSRVAAMFQPQSS